MTARDDSLALPRRSLLERLVTAHTKDSGIAAKRIRHWISSMVLLGALDRVRAGDDSHHFVIKGGVALELRLGLQARATRDVDLTFHGDPSRLADALAEALALPYSGFTFTRSDLVAIGTTGALRAAIKLAYGGKGWMTVDLELSVATSSPADIELIPAISVQDFQLDGPEHVATLSLRYQIAQKLHAVTETFPEGENRRVRDILDLVLLRDLLVDLAPVREACTAVFTERATTEWPPDLRIYDSWPDAYAHLASDLAVPAPTFDDAIELVRRFIADVDSAR